MGYSRLTMLRCFQVDSKGTQPYIYMYPFFPKTKIHLVKAMVFPVVMYGCESWTVKKAECRRIDAFELWCWRTLESPLDCKEINPVSSRGNQSWIFIERINAKVEAPILCSPDAKSQLIRKNLMLGRIEDKRRRG